MILEKKEVNIKSKKIYTYQAIVNINKQKKIEAGKSDGFWLLATNHCQTTNEAFSKESFEIINPHCEKIVIESAFRDIKLSIDVPSDFVWSDKHVKAQYTICVLSYLINRTLTLKLHKKTGNITKDIVSHDKLYNLCLQIILKHSGSKFEIKGSFLHTS